MIVGSNFFALMLRCFIASVDFMCSSCEAICASNMASRIRAVPSFDSASRPITIHRHQAAPNPAFMAQG